MYIVVLDLVCATAVLRTVARCLPVLQMCAKVLPGTGVK
eukprot:SAG25_NODE_8477_length_420_cov_0.641745_1_plen_38_part_01